MGEIATADASDGSVKVQSPQTDPTSKSASAKESGSTAPSSGRQKPKVVKGPPERGAQGRVKTQWDNPAADPNKRTHIGEDPTGESNVID
jgi:hypothetical protein